MTLASTKPATPRSLSGLLPFLRPYRLRWMEECLIPEDFDAHLALRERLPGAPVAAVTVWEGPDCAATCCCPEAEG